MFPSTDKMPWICSRGQAAGKNKGFDIHSVTSCPRRNNCCKWAGDISDDRLDRIIKNQESISDQDALNISTALYYAQKPRFKEVAFYFCKNYTYSSIWLLGF